MTPHCQCIVHLSLVSSNLVHRCSPLRASLELFLCKLHQQLKSSLSLSTVLIVSNTCCCPPRSGAPSTGSIRRSPFVPLFTGPGDGDLRAPSKSQPFSVDRAAMTDPDAKLCRSRRHCQSFQLSTFKNKTKLGLNLQTFSGFNPRGNPAKQSIMRVLLSESQFLAHRCRQTGCEVLHTFNLHFRTRFPLSLKDTAWKMARAFVSVRVG